MPDNSYGRILAGDEKTISNAFSMFKTLPVDQTFKSNTKSSIPEKQTTLGAPFSVTGPGTFFGKEQRTLRFEPTDREGWWFDRSDLKDSLPIHVSIFNVWTTIRNIVLRSGSPHNYMRMVEHIIALKTGMNLDNVLIRLDSGDPPLFDRSSMDLVEGVEKVGIVEQDSPAFHVTVTEPVTVGGPGGSFLTFLPAENGSKELEIDCAIDFKSAIGKQRIKFTVDNESFRHGAFARTNTTLGMLIYGKSIGKLFADMRNLGYTTKNILVAGKKKYFNDPNLIHEGKSLEAAWHRSTLDLLAAIALIDVGRFAGKVISYKAGHALDVLMITKLYQEELLKGI